MAISATVDEEDDVSANMMDDESVGDESSHHGDGSSKPTARQLQETEEKNKLLQRKEEKAVSLVRIAVYVVVLITSILVPVSVYLYTKNEQENDFQTVFNTYANKVAETFIDAVDRKIVAIGGLSTEITNYALSNGLTFPNVTIDNWFMLAGQTRIQADAYSVEYAPLVTEEDRLGWEDYAYNHKGWVKEQWKEEVMHMDNQDEYYGLLDEEEEEEEAPDKAASGEDNKVEGTNPVLQQVQGPDGEVDEEVGLDWEDTEVEGTNPILQQFEHGDDEEAATTTPPNRFLAEGPPPPPSGGGAPPPEGGSPPGEGGGGDGGKPKGKPPPPGYTKEIFGLGPPPKKGPPPSIPLPPGSGPYAPFWHMSPILPKDFLLNNDLQTRPGMGDAIQQVYETQAAALSAALGVRDPNNITLAELVPIRITHDYIKRGQYRHELAFYGGDATTNLIYPVFDTFGENRTVAGILLSPLMWRLNFEKIVPEGLSFIATIKNKRSEPFSFLIDGPKVTYLGYQDPHLSKYDDMFVFQNMGETLKINHSPKNQAFDSVEVDFGGYVLYIYPTQQLENGYIDNTPAVYASIVAAVFAFTILVLVAFDMLVARRQQVMMKKAVKSSALISTLYPEDVKKRLMEEDKTMKENAARKKWKNPEAAAGGGEGEVKKTAIAKLYPASTILLMDLAGFTKWSSKRTPEEVFELLESLYQSFDRIATKKGVYKIETIGDCWVGVTGVPNPQDDHAVRMARFAAACQVKMGQLIAYKLTDQLGADTADLKLRVGMHSGPITGGVLKGDKGRFQLFGDSINTASRMESNGIPGKIQVSQSTADELIRHGYGDWLTERPDKITAKGKGLMTTYWVAIKNLRGSEVRTSSCGVSSTDGGSVLGFTPEDEPSTSPEVLLEMSHQEPAPPVPPPQQEQALPPTTPLVTNNKPPPGFQAECEV